MSPLQRTIAGPAQDPRGRARRPLSAAACVLALCACHEAARPARFDSARVAPLDERELRLGASAAERFGFAEPAAAANEPERELVWTTPAGWSELAPTAMRSANFRTAGGAECYLTLLGGDAGGLAANVDRWRAQMSLAPASEVELAGLERVSMLGREAVMVDLRGTWTGMSGGANQAGQRLVGALLVTPDGSAFLKMVGAEDALESELDAFRALAASFRLAAPPAPAATDDRAAGFTWIVPDGWRRAPDRAARAVSFYVGPQDDVECYVTVLAGDGGGELANVDRWRGQLGLAPLGEGELETLPRAPMLDGEALVVELEGDSGAMLLGALRVEGTRSVFVKLGGPREVVAAQRLAFLEFCGSLAEAR
jgi:hypothetical protein